VDDVDKLQIAELAAQTGFTPPTLRYYEQVGLLDAPERSQAGTLPARADGRPAGRAQ